MTKHPLEHVMALSEKQSERIVIGIVISLFVLVILSGCNPRPIPTPPPGPEQIDGDCPKDKGFAMRCPGQIYGVSDCYVCTKAAGCYDEGNHWCSRDQMCSDCSTSPVDFDRFKTKRPDAGVSSGADAAGVSR